jgi:hypothetical protein
MLKSKSKSHGGKRDGAGRPTLSNGDRRVALPARVHPSTMTALKTISESNDKSIGAVIDEMASAYLLRSRVAAISDAPRPSSEEFSSKKKLTAARQQHVIGALSKFLSDGPFEQHELSHFLNLGRVATGGAVEKVATDYGKHKVTAVEMLLGLAMAALDRAIKEATRKD